jgi:outer membrane lipoprotein-sorting protein
VRFDSPADIKGTSTLTIQHEGAEDDLWVYLPALKKVRRLLSSNRRDSYVGTEFSFGDIAGLRIEDWTHSFRPEVTLGGAPCWLIESIAASAKVSAETGYSRMMTTVRKDNLVQVQIDYFDTAGRALKTGVMSDLREVDAAEHRWQAMRLEMTNATNKRSSSIQFGEYKVNVAVPASSFTSAALEG